MSVSRLLLYIGVAPHSASLIYLTKFGADMALVSGQVYRFRSVAFSNLVLDLKDGKAGTTPVKHLLSTDLEMYRLERQRYPHTWLAGYVQPRFLQSDVDNHIEYSSRLLQALLFEIRQ